MPEVTANGLNIHYRDAGEGFPIVFLHGFTGNTRNWALTVPSLRDRFRCVSIDHLGHGQSDKPADTAFYALANMAAVAYAGIREIGIEECYLVGHSMGGMISQHILLDHPELVRALVLVDTAAAPITGFESWNEKLRQTARDEGIE
ncbi:MAG TPA: alpha/beta fold hydrolase, partial [Dehalococcoidia bacterium]